MTIQQIINWVNRKYPNQETDANKIIDLNDIYKEVFLKLQLLDNVYKEDDIILAVGVGSGISLIHNCLKNRIHNSFIGIDGSKEQIEIAKSNAKLNGINFSMFELIEGYTGNPIHVYGEHGQHSKKMIDINNKDFDVLELDCEGSEIEILRDLLVRPRHIIVEMHPMNREININKFLEQMKNKGYKLGKIFTVNGDSVIINNLDNYFSTEFIDKMKNNEISWGDGLLVLNFTLR
jgi:cellulose biosynthesis protein BcsQ